MTDTVNLPASRPAAPDIEREIAALSTSIMGLDSARRVGWAKAFDALRRVDGLEEELRQSRDELKWLRRCYSRLLGFLTTVPISRSEVFNEEMALHHAAERLFRHDDAWDKGVAVGNAHADVIRGRDPEKSKETRRRTKAAFRHVAKALIQDGSVAGHVVRIRHLPYSNEATCSCGETAESHARPKQIYDWKLQHLAGVVHGREWREFYREQREVFLAEYDRRYGDEART